MEKHQLHSYEQRLHILILLNFNLNNSPTLFGVGVNVNHHEAVPDQLITNWRYFSRCCGRQLFLFSLWCFVFLVIFALVFCLFGDHGDCDKPNTNFHLNCFSVFDLKTWINDSLWSILPKQLVHETKQTEDPTP